MATIKRLDRLDVNTADLNDAVKTYQRNFGLRMAPAGGGTSATVSIGDAQIGLFPAPQSDAEGMAGVWLEAGDVDTVSTALSKAGYSFKPLRVESGRRVLEVDAKSANEVSLYIFDRKV